MDPWKRYEADKKIRAGKQREGKEATANYRARTGAFTQSNSEGVSEAKARHKENYETAIRAARGGSLPRPFIPAARKRKAQR